MGILCHLVRSSSVYDGFDEDSQILSRLPGLVPFEADAEPRRAGVVEGHLKHELLLSILRNHARHAGHLVPLDATESNGGRRGETGMMKGKGWERGEGRRQRVSSLSLNSLQKLN